MNGSMKRPLRESVRATAGVTPLVARRRRRTPVIWYAPHPDDETIYMGGSISLERRRRNIVVVMTRGGASKAWEKINAHVAHPLDAEGFQQARQRELAAAVAALGVGPGDLLVHDLPDSGVEVDAARRIIRSMAARYPGAQHRTMSYLDPHPDHRACGQALRDAYRAGEVSDCVFHLPVLVVSPDLGAPVTFDAAAVERKRAALREYEVWNPSRHRYALGAHSVAQLIRKHYNDPIERVHGPDYELPEGR